jgi:hypothetical protein
MRAGARGIAGQQVKFISRDIAPVEGAGSPSYRRGEKPPLRLLTKGLSLRHSTSIVLGVKKEAQYEPLSSG